MKPIAGDSGRRVFLGRRQFVWAAVLSLLMSTPGLAQTSGQGLPAIRGGLLFEHPLEAVAESPAAAQEASGWPTTRWHIGRGCWWNWGAWTSCR
jgi:hypothetical protein